ncbi:MAG: hypothetical protein K0S16_1653 [Moraxellaceae bacterium]|nr:hypothetical protein [Moraxellaceae bacterium]
MADDVKPPSPPVVPARPGPVSTAALETLRTRCMPLLGELVAGMLNNFQATVFDWMRDIPEAEQQPYLDIAALVKRKRSEIETQTANALAAGFTRLQPVSGDKGKAAQTIDFSKLSLVGTEDMDVTVAVDSLVARARLRLAAPLSLLRRRYAHVLGRAELAERDMPLDPSGVATAFGDALANAEASAAGKVIALRVLQRKVLDEMEPLLDEANQIFISAGVLPDLKVASNTDQAKKPKAEKPKPEQPKKDDAKSARDTEQIFSFLQNILGGAGGQVAEPLPGAGVAGMQFHGGQYVGGGGIGSLPAEAIGGSVAAVPLAPQQIAPTATVQKVETPELVTKLSQIQQDQPKTALAEESTSPSVEEVRTSIRDNLRSDEVVVEAIKRTDEDVINLVSMLFDLVLGDKDLPAAMRSLIGRLQIPMLKVAILDKAFFHAEDNPARRLLNALAKAGIGWNSRSAGGDVLYAKIENVVSRILHEFVDDLGLFEQLLADFNAFHEQQQKRAETVDRRTRETEEGRARAELARAMVQQTLNRRLAGRQLPLVVIRLLQEGWRNVLYINCLKEGTSSEAWKQAVKVVDAVMWSIMPQPGPDWQARLRALAPKLYNSVKKGLASVNYDSLAAEKLLRELQAVHIEQLRGTATRTVSVVEAKPGEVSREEGQVTAAEVAKADAEKVAAVVLPEAQTTPPPIPDALPEDNEFVVLVNRLNVGCWVEFSDGDKVDRQKLVARIRSVDKLIFADRRGVKVGEMPGMKLAMEMNLGRARLLAEAQFIDRALESMIGNLRDLSSKATVRA